ncbi:MAG: hypothetical protein AB1545_05705 [Thermodesulfobacteriota bacterium]|jgi:hypothetical protein
MKIKKQYLIPAILVSACVLMQNPLAFAGAKKDVDEELSPYKWGHWDRMVPPAAGPVALAPLAVTAPLPSPDPVDPPDPPPPPAVTPKPDVPHTPGGSVQPPSPEPGAPPGGTQPPMPKPEAY